MAKVAIVGFGNLGFHLSQHLSQFHQVSIFQRNSGQHQPLKNLRGKKFDFIILCVPDRAIAPVAQSITAEGATVLHSSGSTDLNALSTHHKHGVIYPLQTFSRKKEVNFSSFPFFIEGNDKAMPEIIQFTKSFTNNYQIIDSEQRLRLHLAAVVACNFSNYLFDLAEKQLSKAHLDFQLLKDLLLETVQKAVEIGPTEAQTGPAKRNDHSTIQKHLSILEGKDQELYRLMTTSIQEKYNAD